MEKVKLIDSISMRLLRYVFGTYCIITLLLTTLQMWNAFSQEKAEIKRSLSLYQPLFEQTLSNEIWHMDLEQVQVTLNSILLLPEIVGVSIHDAQGHYIARKGTVSTQEKELPVIDVITTPPPLPPFAQDLFWHRFDLRTNANPTEKLGEVFFYSNTAVAIAKVHDLFWSIISFALAKTLLLWVIFLHFGRILLSKPLLELIATTASFAKDQTGEPLVVTTQHGNEIEILKQTFAKMAKQLREAMASLTQGYAKLKVIAAVLDISAGSKTIGTLFTEILHELVHHPWPGSHDARIQGACVFLHDPTDNHLVMQAHHGLPEETVGKCSRPAVSDDCLCGRTFLRGTPLFSHRLEQSCQRLESGNDTNNSGFYGLPILSSTRDKVIGVLICYAQQEIPTQEATFLASIANALTNLIERKVAEDALYQHQHHLEQLVQERTKQLAHAERLASLGTFSAGMAHEINNPNSFISGNIAFLKQFWQLSRPILERNSGQDKTGRIGAFLDDVGATLDGMMDGVKRISKIIDSLKAYSRGGMETDKVECRLEEPIQDAEYLLQHRIKKGILLSIQVSADIVVVCDRQQMSQVFVNLMGNAMDAMESTGSTKEKRLTISAEQADGHIWIHVKDNGPGIPQDAIGRIFDPFYSSKGKTKGTGLGLSIVHGIIQDHAGQITVYSSADPNEDTDFLIILPTRETYHNLRKNRKLGFGK